MPAMQAALLMLIRLFRFFPVARIRAILETGGGAANARARTNDMREAQMNKARDNKNSR